MAENKEKSSFQELMDEGQSLYDKELYKEAIKTYKIALIMAKKIDKTSLASLYIRLANTYYKIDDKDKATYYYEEYLKEYPSGQVSVFSRLAHAYFYIDTDKSIDYHNKALNIEVNKYDSACKLFAMTKSSYYDQQDIKDESEYEVAQIKSNLFKNIKKYDYKEKKKQKNKKLNIGYLSSDCHAHTMMNYMIPIWENHNQEKFNFFIFNGSDKEDATTEKIKEIGFKMIPCSKLEDSGIAKLIHDNDIDILIDLGGYTHLKTYANLYKPAPIIISYLGYLNTLGMKEVDYILADRFSIPEDKAYLYTEKPLYLDKGYQIFMEKQLPNIEDNPFKKNGYITFGSFNCTSKINDTTIYLWSKILKTIPDSKLLIYRTQLTRKIIRFLKEKFDKRGITPERLIFSSHKYDIHYRAYCQADISLDPYPFSGMSIAIETALMGVPTISLLGEGLQSRGAGRINHVLNLDEFNAECGDDYVKAACELANDRNKLSDLRNSLRNKINESELRVNEKAFTQDLESKYEKVWADFINNP